MDADELVLERQQQQLVKELGQLRNKKSSLNKDLPSIEFAKIISHKLKINYGSALALTFWIDELQKVYPHDKKQTIFSKQREQRLIHVGRLIKIAGGEKGLSFVLDQLPAYGARNFKSFIDPNDTWKQKKSYDILDD